MSIAILSSRAQLGIDAPPVTIEVFLSGGLPRFNVVGMPETAVRESGDRVRGAIINSGYPFPRERITVSLAPADMRKTGGRFDLAIALGILAAQKIIPASSLEGTEFFGELSLNGELRSVPGMLPAALRAAESGHSVFVPQANVDEAVLVSGEVRAADSLLGVVAHLKGASDIAARARVVPAPTGSNGGPDLAEVRGQVTAKRALEIAAAGGHNLLFIGPPGTGKSMLARRLPGILPPMSEAEALETAGVDSVLGHPIDFTHWRRRPFRAPHHTASAPALVGGGSGPRPGEISRAHNGVLFLDELPEFNRNVLEVLREPLEAGFITISRAAHQADFPARVQLVAAMNPCPCGYLGDAHGACNCSADRVANYRRKISGPLLDRIDLHVEVQRPTTDVLRGNGGDEESSVVVAARVARARRIAIDRSGTCNAALEGEMLETLCDCPAEGMKLVDEAIEHFGLSMRSCHRVLRVSRTIADLAEADAIARMHVAEALSLRILDRNEKRGIDGYWTSPTM
jgi:magnesium chelatase family protein